MKKKTTMRHDYTRVSMHIGLHSAHYTLQTYRMHAHTVLTLSFPFLPFLVFSVELPESLLKTDDVEMITKAK